MRASNNALTVEVYNAFSGTRVDDPRGDLLRAQVRWFESFFPGGLFGAAEIWVPRDPTANWLFKQGQRLVIRNALAVVYEGMIASLGYLAGANGEAGRVIRCAGYWGQLLGTRGLRKPWCDTRLSADVWVEPAAADASDNRDICIIDRNNRIRFVPKAEAWGNGEYTRVLYTTPTGQTIKRLTFSYDLQEGGQAWTLGLYNTATGLWEWAVTASGAGAADVTFGTAPGSVFFFYMSNAAQTPTADGTYYGEISNLKVYTETGSITATEIVKDWRAAITDLNADETNLGANTLTLEPWLTGANLEYEMAADHLARLARLGDASFNPWACYLLESERAATPNGKPVLAFAQQPALTDYDYAMWVDEPVLGSLSLYKTDVWNWIVVTYTDAQGFQQWVTPDDDANLKDATSIAAYGQREFILRANTVSSTVAKNLARRFLAANKDPKFYVSGDVPIRGYLTAKMGPRVPASQVRAGTRVRIVNFLIDEVGISGGGLTALVSRARYTDADQTVWLSFGVPDNLATFLAQIAAGVPTHPILNLG